AIPNCRSRTGTKNTGCGSNDGHQNKRPIVGAILPNVRDRPSIWEMSVQDPTKRDPTSWTADKKALYPPSHRFNRQQHDGRQDQENVTKMVAKGDTGHGLDGSRQRRASLLGTGCDEVVHTLLDLMYAKAPYTVMRRAMHIHPTVSLLSTILGDLKPVSRADR